MKRLHRLLALLALLTLFLSASCGTGVPAADTEESTGFPAIDESRTHLTVIDDGTVLSRIVYPEGSPNEIRAISTSFEYSFRALATDQTFPRVTDSAEEVAYEVLIGETNRKESRAAYRELRDSGKEGFIVRVSGNKLVFAGTSADMLERAYSYFAILYMIENETSTLAIPVTEDHVEYPFDTTAAPETTADPETDTAS